MESIEKVTKEVENKNGGYLEKVISQISDVVQPSLKCKLCNSKFRAEAEKMYDEGGWGALKNVHNMLLKNGESISKGAVFAHLKNHFEKQRRDIEVKEFIEDTAKYKMGKITKKQALEDRWAILNKHMLVLSAQGEGTSPEEQRKTAMTVKVLSDGITAIENQMCEMEAKNDPVLMMVSLVKQVLKNKMEQTRSEEVKSSIYELLTELGEKMSGILVENNQ